MPCSCFDPCSCAVEAGALINITGSGDVTDPWVISAIETSFAAIGQNGILITPSGGGDYGHSPTIEIEVDPASTAPVSVGPAGIRVDCCDGGSSLTSVTDTDTVDLTLAAGDLSADVIISPDACNSLVANVNGLYVLAGERWVASGEDGLADGASVNVNTTPGGSSGASWRYCFTNSGDCDVILTVFGQASVNAQVSAAATRVDMDVAARLEIEAGSVTDFLGGSAIVSTRFNEMTNTGTNDDFFAGEGITASGLLFASLRIPPAGNAQIKSYLQTTNFDNLNGAVSSGLGYAFTGVHARIVREDSSIPLTISSGAC